MNEYEGTVVVNGNTVAGAFGHSLDLVANTTLGYAQQYLEEIDGGKMTITIETKETKR